MITKTMFQALQAKSMDQRKKPKNEEYHIQCDLVEKIKLNLPDLLFTIAPNGLKVSMGVAIKMKKMGYRRGTPDLIFFEPMDHYHGLLIELKTETGTLSLEQKQFAKQAIEKGYCVLVCRSSSQAYYELLKYLHLERER